MDVFEEMRKKIAEVSEMIDILGDGIDRQNIVRFVELGFDLPRCGSPLIERARKECSLLIGDYFAGDDRGVRRHGVKLYFILINVEKDLVDAMEV